MKRGWLVLALLSGIMWGACGVFVRYFTAAGLSNVTIVFLRVFVGAVIMFVFLVVYDRSLLVIRLRDVWLFLCSGIVGMTCLNYCYNVAINTLSIAFAAVLLSMAPIFVLIISAILFREKITGRKVFCVVLAIIGCALVSGFLDNLGTQVWSARGIVIGIFSAVFYASYSIFSKLAMKQGYGALTITFYSMVAASLALVFFADWSQIDVYVAGTPVASSIILLAHALTVAVLPYILFTLSLTRADAGKAAILAAGGEPAAAMVFGAIFFAEIPSWTSLVGLVITIFALALLMCSEKHTDE